MLKKAVQQGRSERRGEEVHAALRAGRLPLVWILANGKAPPVLPTSENILLNVEPLSDARTPLADFFSIMLETRRVCLRKVGYTTVSVKSWVNQWCRGLNTASIVGIEK